MNPRARLPVRVLLVLLAVALASAALAQPAPAPGAGAEQHYRVDPLGPGLWRIQAIAGTLSTAYLVSGSRAALLIDTCTGQPGLNDVVKPLSGALPVIVALTHGHGDHSGGAKYFPAFKVHPADHALIPASITSTREPLAAGDRFDLGGRTIEVIGIPGHTPGSVAFLDRAGRFMMTGDAIGSSMVWMQLAVSAPLTEYVRTLGGVEALKGAIDTLYVGHHEQERVPLTPTYISDMRTATRRVLEGSIETRPYEMGSRSGRSATVGSATLVFDPDKLGTRVEHPMREERRR